jgi:hypothetical protein
LVYSNSENALNAKRPASPIEMRAVCVVKR